MNLKNYLNQLENKSIDTQTAYNTFNELHPNLCSYSYFRTKYNAIKENTEHKGAQELKNSVDKNLSLGVLEIKKYEKDFKIELAEPMPTGTFFDEYISKRGGFMRKCVDVVVGPPGAGKTYSRNALAIKAKQFNPDLRIGFICAEMRESEWLEEIASDPYLAEIDVVYMLKYVGKSNYLEILSEALSKFDIVVLDSFAVIIHHLMMVATKGMTERKIIFDLIDFLTESVEKNNNNIQLINQVTKSGDYKGGTELPHMTSSLSFVRVENRKRYMEFTKNRNNGRTINRLLFFNKDPKNNNQISFDEEAYKASYERVEDTKVDIKTFLENLKQKHEQTSEDNKDLLELEKDKNLTLSQEQVADNQTDLIEQIAEFEEYGPEDL